MLMLEHVSAIDNFILCVLCTDTHDENELQHMHD